MDVGLYICQIKLLVPCLYLLRTLFFVITHGKCTNLCLVILIQCFASSPTRRPPCGTWAYWQCLIFVIGLLLAVLDFWQITARSWLLGVNNENTSTVKAASYQTQQHMGILLASAWSIMLICDCHNQLTKPLIFHVECTFSSHHNCLGLHWCQPCWKNELTLSEH